jgi:aldose 1-epimerase
LVQQLTVHAGDQDMPATLGWHPWFRRQLERGGPLSLDADMRAASWFEKDDEGIPTGRLRVVRPRPWDDCFRGVGSIALEWPAALRIDVEHDCDDVVLYDPPHAICVEPQSGPPDAFTIDAAGCRVAAGSSLERTVTWRWRMGSAV